VAFLGAALVPGVDIISEAVSLTEHLQGAALVLTGEGRLDGQTAFGKTVAGVATRARALAVPVVAIVGELAASSEELQALGIDAALSIAPGPITLEQATREAAKLVTDATERALRLVLMEPRRD
jgi:glycerate kinase